MEIVIASKNLHKIREIREMFKSLRKIDILSLLNFPDYIPPPEIGEALEENAVRKASHASNALQKWVLADDSGLFVPALKGAPGVYSKRYACDDATDSENRQKLLKEMSGLEGLKRSAYFECCLVLSSPNEIKKITKGKCEGTIIEKEKGRNGFGYDSLFVKHDYDRTFSELEESTKNRISHRRKAFEKLLPILEPLNF